MRKILLLAGFCFSAGLHGQTAADLNLGATVSLTGPTVPPTFTFSWWGKAGSHYIVESSFDLVAPWVALESYNPPGADAALHVEFTTNSPRIFFRAYQFDPNDITGLADTDMDGLPDKWELYYFGGLGRNGTEDWNNDGLLDRDAFRFGLNPKGDDESEIDGKFDEFSYDARGWLDGMTLTGNASVSFGLDDEGNIETAN